MTKLSISPQRALARLEQAGDVRLNATVLMREIQSNGYDVGITRLKEFLAQIRPQTIIDAVEEAIVTYGCQEIFNTN